MKKEKKNEEQLIEPKILKITDLDGIGPTTDEKLKSKGYDTILSIAVANPSEIVEVTGLTEAKARKIIQICRDNLDFGFTNALKSEEKQLVTISTGSKKFDEMIGGGIKAGHVTEIYGKPGCGKTQLAMQLCVNLYKQNSEYKSVYIDTENSFSIKRIREMSIAQNLNPDDVLKSIEHVSTFNSDHQSFMTEKAEELIKNNSNIKLLIIDSIMNHYRVDFSGRGQLADRQQKIAKHIHKLHKIALLYDIIVYCANQVMDDPGCIYGNPIRVVGGNVLQHVVKLIVYLSKSKEGIKARLIKHPEMPDAEIMYQVKQEGITDE